jgi:hypothetical protein
MRNNTAHQARGENRSLSNVARLDLPDSSNPAGDWRPVDIACLRYRQMPITGHQTLEEVEQCSRPASQKMTADAAMQSFAD